MGFNHLLRFRTIGTAAKATNTTGGEWKKSDVVIMTVVEKF